MEDKRHIAVHDMHLDDEDEEVSMQESDVVKSKVFNFHSIRSVIIAKVKQKAVKRNTCEYKTDTGSDDNLMPIRMYKMLYSDANINE